MSALLDNYPQAVQEQFLQSYAEAGYTHLQRSLGHALNYGGTIDTYIALSRKARQEYGLWCDHWILGGEALNTRDQDASYWQPILDPYLDRIIGAGVADLACVGWQLDAYNTPGNPLISIIAYMGGKFPSSTPLYTHWMNEALAWWVTGGQVWSDKYQTINVTDRFTWWAAMQPYLTGGHHQGSNEMAVNDPKQYQDRLCDTLDPFGGDVGKGNMGQSHRTGTPTPFKLTAYEVTAQFQFDGQLSELEGDKAGYLTMCTTSHTGLPMAGYGNGARLPSGLFL